MATNYEHYKKEIDEINKTNTFCVTKFNEFALCKCTTCANCIFSKIETGYKCCEKSKIEWLFQEYQEPIIMNETTCHVALALPDDRYVCRDRSGRIILHKTEPKKNENIKLWLSEGGGDYIYCGIFKEPIFEFIKSEDKKAWSTNELKKMAREQMKKYE